MDVFMNKDPFGNKDFENIIPADANLRETQNTDEMQKKMQMQSYSNFFLIDTHMQIKDGVNPGVIPFVTTNNSIPT